MTAGNEKHNKVEPETIVSLSEEHVSDKKLNIKDFFLSSEELEKIHKKKFKYVLQHDAMDCGAASMATVAKYMVDGLICRYRALVHVTRDGASMLAVKKAAERLASRLWA